MAERKPLVLDDNNEVQQIQSGDTLLATVSGGDNIVLQNTHGSTINACEAVYSGGGTGQVKKAINNDTIAKARVVGLAMTEILNSASGAIIEGGNFSQDVAFWEMVTGETGVGLTPHAVYWLDSTAGKITKTPPTTGYVTRIGIALKSDLLFIDIDPPIKL